MPMRMGVRGKLFLVSVAMVLAVVFLAGLYLEGQLVEWAQGRAEVELQGHARLVRVLLEHRQDGDSDLDLLADRAAAPIDARVTIIAADGRVVGDSEFPAGRLGEMEPHGDRPEVIAALPDRDDVRYFGRTITEEMRYRNLLRSLEQYRTKVYGADDPTLGRVGVTLGGLINDASISTWNGIVGINVTPLVDVRLELGNGEGDARGELARVQVNDPLYLRPRTTQRPSISRCSSSVRLPISSRPSIPLDTMRTCSGRPHEPRVCS